MASHTIAPLLLQHPQIAHIHTHAHIITLFSRSAEPSCGQHRHPHTITPLLLTRIRHHPIRSHTHICTYSYARMHTSHLYSLISHWFYWAIVAEELASPVLGSAGTLTQSRLSFSTSTSRTHTAAKVLRFEEENGNDANEEQKEEEVRNHN